MLRSHLTRTRLGLMLAVAVGVMLGAVFGQAGSGRAASAAVPANTSPPTISGAAESGQTLTATHGKWSGSPSSFSYAWSRCDSSGAACAGIAGATAKIYTVTDADVGHTLRVTVTAKNASGSGHATSAPTSVVTSGGCPPGTGTIPISTLAPPARLEITSASVARPVTYGTHTIRFDIQVTACGGRPVQGAVVSATPIPFNQFKGSPIQTAANGKVTVTETRLSGFPAARRQRLLAVLLRAVKSGEPVIAGVSTVRVVSFHVSR